MTDILTTAPVTGRRIELPRLHLPWRAFAASIEAMAGLIGRASLMAYVDPYTRLNQNAPDENLEGRDPNW